jgi:death-on-curing protein
MTDYLTVAEVLAIPIERYGGSHGVRDPGLLESATTYTFLAINGAQLTATARGTQNFVLALYDGSQFTFDRLVPWLRRHVVFARRHRSS